MTTTTELSYCTAPNQVIRARNGIDYAYREIGTSTTHLIRQGGERVAKAISVLMEADDTTDRVGTIRHPALVIHGRRDIPIPFDRGEELARALQGSGVIAGIDEAGHTPPVTHSEHTLEAVKRFLSN